MAKHSAQQKAKGSRAAHAKKATGAQRPRSPRTPWTKEEDDQLKSLVAAMTWKPGRKVSWACIAALMPTRNHKQCRERWHSSLQPGLSNKAWTSDEDALILGLQMKLGNQWVLIAEELPGRTDSAVKNRWHTLKRSAEYKKRAGIVAEKKATKVKNDPIVSKTIVAAANETVAAMTTGVPTVNESPKVTVVSTKRPDFTSSPFSVDPRRLEAAYALKALKYSAVPPRAPVQRYPGNSALFFPQYQAMGMGGPAMSMLAVPPCHPGLFFSPLKAPRPAGLMRP